jgi:hypothetical protein
MQSWFMVLMVPVSWLLFSLGQKATTPGDPRNLLDRRPIDDLAGSKKKLHLVSSPNLVR